MDSSSPMTLIMIISGADPGFQVRGANLKKLRLAEGGGGPPGSVPGAFIQKFWY